MAVIFSSDRTFASMSFTLSFANTGVNNPSFIVVLLRSYRTFVQTPPAAWLSRIASTTHAAAIAVFERGERRRLGFVGRPAAGDEAVDVPHHVAERIGPCFLVAARQVRVRRAPS